MPPHALVARALSLMYGDKVAIHRKGSKRRPLTTATERRPSIDLDRRRPTTDDERFVLDKFLKQFPRPPSYMAEASGRSAKLTPPRRGKKIISFAQQRDQAHHLRQFIPTPLDKDAPMAVLEIALAYVLNNEGTSFVNDPQDKGGPTRFGITQATLSVYQKAPASVSDVQNLDPRTVADVYKTLFWRPIGGDKINNQAVATTLLDLAVLCGPTMSIKMAQALVQVEIDGLCGPKTLAAINAARPAEFVANLSLSACTYFGAIVIRDKTQSKWLAGWQRRAHKMLHLVTP